MTIKLKGRIDSENSTETEKKINEQIACLDGDLIIDASELEYISSAGLRIILRLKKANSSTKIINCTSDVYEIFDMTGFTEMMDISKAYRKISIEGCEIIGEGANGLVYRTDPDTIVKVYKNHDSLEEIHNERELARKAFIMGIPTAIPYDVVQVGDLYGSVFELLNAKSFAKLVNEGEDVDSLVRQSVEILKTIHSTFLKDGELPDKKDESINWAEFCVDYLPKETGEKLVEMFKAIPKTNNIIHGDYHIKNIMQQNGENLLIDMDTLSMGHPIFEFAAIFAAYKGFSCIDEDNCCKFLGIPTEKCRKFLDLTYKYYFEGESEETVNEIKEMSAIICYTRILRWYIKKRGFEDEESRLVIEFCKKYLIENVPKINKLYF